MPQPKVKLVVTGDDFGYCERRNQGIVDCFKAGGISNVSLLVNAVSAKHASDLAKRYHIPIGLHANLSEGLPVSRELKGSTLLNKDGFFHGKMGFRDVLQSGQLKMSEVEVELRAQVNHFFELVGHMPDHMDGHQHVHVLPEVREVFARVLSDFGITYTRVPVEPGLKFCTFLPSHLRDFYTQVEKDALESVEVFHRHDIRWPDIYLGLSTMGKYMSISNLKRALVFTREARVSSLDDSVNSPLIRTQTDETTTDSYRPVTAELMVHPGYPSHPHQGGCGDGPDDFSQSTDRLHELNTLRDPLVLSYYRQQRIHLCAFKDI
ncbi:carbohydrate deacetylase [Myxocyprinus asiaticus]|uniref:carbohydrate deacetylase n=1 Tax=Myxocyprinus asiaticus TaxID=70543 RepID=UPI002223BEFB|nr:carbohydrate deacetylase [Myxocyprinus asiaticus]XP_051514702.1 carbohydrate deacetylase [Myxocyprinus asiaticus]XP_051514709.1 carbohydrate deacetylase [Myxocyprinus asiaticus]